MVGRIKRPEANTRQITFNDYLDLFDLSHQQMKEFSFRPRNSQTQAVDADMNLSFLNVVLPGTKDSKGHSQTWWTVVTPPAMKSFSIPRLPEGLSTFPTLKPSEQLEWVLNRFALSAEPTFFNYHNFDEQTIGQRLSHFSRNGLVILKTKGPNL